MKKFRLIIQIVLGVLILFLGYLCYESIMVPQRFQQIKKARYDRVIERLKDIRSAQEAYKGVYGLYTHSFDTLINFIKYDSVEMIRSIGSLTDEQIESGMTEAEAIRQGFIIREAFKVSALEYVFNKDYPVDNLRYIPINNNKHEFQMKAAILRSETGVDIPVFEARASNTVIFEGVGEEYEEAVKEENGERKRLNKYPGLKVGNIEEANNNIGNWE